MQIELADALGIHPSGMAKIMAGKRRIKIEELAIISRFIGQPVPLGAVDEGSAAARISELEDENTRLKALLSEYLLRDALAKK